MIAKFKLKDQHRKSKDKKSPNPKHPKEFKMVKAILKTRTPLQESHNKSQSKSQSKSHSKEHSHPKNMKGKPPKQELINVSPAVPRTRRNALEEKTHQNLSPQKKVALNLSSQKKSHSKSGSKVKPYTKDKEKHCTNKGKENWKKNTSRSIRCETEVSPFRNDFQKLKKKKPSEEIQKVEKGVKVPKLKIKKGVPCIRTEFSNRRDSYFDQDLLLRLQANKFNSYEGKKEASPHARHIKSQLEAGKWTFHEGESSREKEVERLRKEQALKWRVMEFELINLKKNGSIQENIDRIIAELNQNYEQLQERAAQLFPSSGRYEFGETLERQLFCRIPDPDSHQEQSEQDHLTPAIGTFMNPIKQVDAKDEKESSQSKMLTDATAKPCITSFLLAEIPKQNGLEREPELALQSHQSPGNRTKKISLDQQFFSINPFKAHDFFQSIHWEDSGIVHDESEKDLFKQFNIFVQSNSKGTVKQESQQFSVSPSQKKRQVCGVIQEGKQVFFRQSTNQPNSGFGDRPVELVKADLFTQIDLKTNQNPHLSKSVGMSPVIQWSNEHVIDVMAAFLKHLELWHSSEVMSLMSKPYELKPMFLLKLLRCCEEEELESECSIVEDVIRTDFMEEFQLQEYGRPLEGEAYIFNHAIYEYLNELMDDLRPYGTGGKLLLTSNLRYPVRNLPQLRKKVLAKATLKEEVNLSHQNQEDMVFQEIYFYSVGVMETIFDQEAAELASLLIFSK